MVTLFFFEKATEQNGCHKPLASVAEPHHLYAAPAPGINFDAAPAPAPTLRYSKAQFLKRTEVYTPVETTISFSYDSVRFTVQVYC
jgi:hypothetical protein